MTNKIVPKNQSSTVTGLHKPTQSHLNISMITQLDVVFSEMKF